MELFQMDVGPHFNRMESCITSSRRLCKILDVPYEGAPGQLTQASLIRVLMKAHKSAEFELQCKKQNTRKPKLRYKEDLVRKFIAGDPAQRVIGLELLEIIPFSPADQTWIMGFDNQVDTEARFMVPAKLEHLPEVERIGKRYVPRQVDSRTMAGRLKRKSESIAVMEHHESDRLRGMIRWWNINEVGLQRIETGAIRSGSEIAESDKSPTPSAAFYIAMVAGEDLWAQGRVMQWLTNILRSEPYAAVPILARPSTCAGFRALKKFGFERIPQPGSRIYCLKQALT